MTDTEAIEAVKRGERVAGPYSQHVVENFRSDCQHHWRVLFCNDEHDVIECSKCGRQQVCRCNFEDDCA